MANRTDPLAASVHGTNPQNIMEKIVRMKIYDSMYWKEHCFGLTAETLVDKAVELRYISGTYGGARKPSEFLCLILKMLQIQPDKEIVVEFIKNEEYKYVRLLGAFYLRLVGKPLEVYRYLEPLFNDYRKVRLRKAEGDFSLSHMDEVVDEMLHKDYLFDIALPRIPRRLTLEKYGHLDKRISVLEEDFDEEAMLQEANRAAEAAEKLQQDMMREAGEKERNRSRSRSRERIERRPREHERERSRSRERRREYERPRSRERERERDRERGRDRDRRGDRGDDRKRRRSTSREREERRKDKKDKKRRDVDEVDPEIAEANAMRAKLGLRPLR